MKNFMLQVLKDKAGEVTPGGEPNKNDPAIPATPPATPPANTPPVEGEGNDDLDELGYKKIPAEGTPPKDGDKPPKNPAEKTEKVEIVDPATGYGDEPLKVEDDPAPPAAPPAPPAEPPKSDDIDKALVGVDPADMKLVKAEVTKLKLSPEQAKEYAALKIEERKNATNFAENQQKENDRARTKLKAAWDNELRTDKDFGGETFGKNVQQGERVLQEFFGEWKKDLTKAKAMLPPNVMRGLARLADQLYKTESLVHGDPSKPAPPPADPVDEALEFYKS